MDLKIRLDHDIEAALRVLGKPKRLFRKTRNISYQFVIIKGILNIKADNGVKVKYIVPNSVDMVSKQIYIQNQEYKYEEIECEN